MALSLSSPALSFSSSYIFHSTPYLSTKSLPCPPPRSTSTSIRSELSTSTLPILSFSGETLSTTTLTLTTAPPSTARAVVHRALIHDRQNARRGTASTLTRGEVRGGGRKPYPQKKTGRARRGSNRTPLRPGGGVIFGPKPKDWSIKMNRKEKKLSISTAIASAAKMEDAFVVQEFEEEFEGGPKTKEFVEALKRWGLDATEKAMFLMMDVSDNVRLSSRNIGTMKMLTPRTLNLFDILDSEKLVFTEGAVEYLNAMYGEGADDDEDDDEEEVLEGGEEEADGEESS